MLGKLWKRVKAHKFATVIIIILALGGGYYGYKAYKGNPVVVSYKTVAAAKGTVVTSVSGSGQVSTSNQVEVKAKASGDVVYLGVVQGQEVRKSALLASLDTTDAMRAVRDAKTSLETAKLELDKLLEPTDALTLLQAENALTTAEDSKQSAEDSLKKSYDDGFTAVANAFLGLPAVITGVHDIFFNNTINVNQNNIDYYSNSVETYDAKILGYKQDVNDKYAAARVSYDLNFSNYKSASRSSDTSVIEALILETYNTTKDIAEAVKSGNDFIQFYKDQLAEHNLSPNTAVTTHLASLNTYTGTVNGYLSNLLSATQAITNYKDAITNADRSIEEKTLSLAKVKASADELDVRAKKIAIQKAEDALTTANQTLADAYVRAPFDGIVAKVNIKKSDTISSGTSVATLIAKQSLIEIALNEVDVAKVKVGQKVNLTFDAIPDLEITGEVSAIDTLGTVSQGVVTYNVQINLDTQDSRVKPGMSVSAMIITDVSVDVLSVPNSAIKIAGNTKYVDVLVNGAPAERTVTTGISSDTDTEIKSGLQEGDQVVTQTITSGGTATGAPATSGFRIPGLGGVGGR